MREARNTAPLHVEQAGHKKGYAQKTGNDAFGESNAHILADKEFHEDKGQESEESDRRRRKHHGKRFRHRQYHRLEGVVYGTLRLAYVGKQDAA